MQGDSINPGNPGNPGGYSFNNAMSGMYNGAKNTVNAASMINKHTWMLVIGVIFLILAVLGFFSICGAQTGSCTTSGIGSAVESSTGGDGNLNPTTEVVGEFLVFLLLGISVGLLTYVWTMSNVSKKLLDGANGNMYAGAALLINGKGAIDVNTLTQIEKNEMMYLTTKFGISPDVLNKAYASSRNLGRGVMNAPANAYNYAMGRGNKASKLDVDVTTTKKPKTDDSDDDDN